MSCGIKWYMCSLFYGEYVIQVCGKFSPQTIEEVAYKKIEWNFEKIR